METDPLQLSIFSRNCSSLSPVDDSPLTRPFNTVTLRVAPLLHLRCRSSPNHQLPLHWRFHLAWPSVRLRLRNLFKHSRLPLPLPPRKLRLKLKRRLRLSSNRLSSST